jgi:FKBP-type peptidyl-prolyl cis-trans isomerase FklB
MDQQTLSRVSQALGYDIGENLKSNGIQHLDAESFNKGLQSAMAGQEAALDEEERQKVIREFIAFSNAIRASKNLEEGIEFLKQNAGRQEVTVLSSGLQYEILVSGSGDSPSVTDHVTTHYHGTTIDGQVFDSSVERGQPATFPLNQVISGWTEALQLMNRGAKWRLFIPPALAYGERGAGSIAPNSTLIFDVELLSF